MRLLIIMTLVFLLPHTNHLYAQIPTPDIADADGDGNNQSTFEHTETDEDGNVTTFSIGVAKSIFQLPSGEVNTWSACIEIIENGQLTYLECGISVVPMGGIPYVWNFWSGPLQLAGTMEWEHVNGEDQWTYNGMPMTVVMPN